MLSHILVSSSYQHLSHTHHYNKWKREKITIQKINISHSYTISYRNLLPFISFLPGSKHNTVFTLTQFFFVCLFIFGFSFRNIVFIVFVVSWYFYLFTTRQWQSGSWQKNFPTVLDELWYCIHYYNSITVLNFLYRYYH